MLSLSLPEKPAVKDHVEDDTLSDSEVTTTQDLISLQHLYD